MLWYGVVSEIVISMEKILTLIVKLISIFIVNKISSMVENTIENTTMSTITNVNSTNTLVSNIFMESLELCMINHGIDISSFLTHHAPMNSVFNV